MARRGGSVAGIAREQTEKELGRSVVSGKNFLPEKMEEESLEEENGEK